MKAKKIYFLSFLALLFFTITGCQRHDLDSSKTPNGGFKLTYSVQGSRINTYANTPAEPGENDINGLWLLFFERTSGGTGLFIEAYKVDAAYPLSMNETTLNINFPAGSTLNNTTAYNILAVTNLEQGENISITVDDFLLHLEGKTENEVVTSTLLNVYEDFDENSPAYNNRKIRTNNIMMSGRTTIEANQGNVQLNLVRTVARIDVQNQAAGFQLRSVSIWNAYPNAPIWNGSFSSFNSVRYQRLYGVGSITTNELKGEIYALENSVGTPKQADDVTTCLIVGMQKDGDAFITYYRVNITPPDMGQQLRRNNSYNLIIRNVLGYGANAEMDAYLSARSSLNYSINSWFVDDRGNIQFDGDRILAVPTSKIAFTPLAETRVFNIFTQGEGTLEISQSQLPTGFTASLNGNDLNVSVIASEVTQSGFIELRFGTLRAVIDISQTGASQPVLLLSTNQLPIFPKTLGAASQSVIVTSSGSWKATIYNGNFTFDPNPAIHTTEKTGNTGDSFIITTTDNNTEPNPWVSFVLVTLDSDPTITRTIVLAQQGAGGISLTPNVSAVDFDVFGASINNYIQIVTESDAAWEVITSGLNASSFIVTEDHVSSPHSITITASTNTEPSILTANLRIRLVDSPTIFKDIALTQQRHSLVLNPSSVASIPSTGGTSQPITVLSSGPWTATISTIGGPQATLTQSTGINGQTFAVTFPKLIIPNASPVATVSVKIDGTNVEQTINVTQQRMPTRTLVFTSMFDYYGSLYPASGQRVYVQQWIDSFNSTANFGPSGTVVFPGFSFLQGVSYDATSIQNGLNLGGGADIYVYTMAAIDAAGGANINNWRIANNKHFLIVNADINCSKAILGYMGMTVGSWQANSTAYLNMKINTNYTVANNALYRFLFRDGPFTDGITDISSAVNLMGGDGNDATVTGPFDPTMIPLIYHPNAPTQMILGIDPTKRIIFLGSIEIFGKRDANQIANWNNAANVKFLKNLSAWITYASLYGDDWVNQFK